MGETFQTFLPVLWIVDKLKEAGFPWDFVAGLESRACKLISLTIALCEAAVEGVTVTETSPT